MNIIIVAYVLVGAIGIFWAMASVFKWFSTTYLYWPEAFKRTFYVWIWFAVVVGSLYSLEQANQLIGIVG